MDAERLLDREILARIGTRVRNRLDAAPAVRRLPDDRAEIYTLDNFLDADCCRHLIDLIDAEAQPSALVDDSDNTQIRTSCSSDIDPEDSVVRRLDARLCALTGLSGQRSEAAQGQRYESGQFFAEHCDWFDTSAEYWQREKNCGGQRSWTAMIYLNAVDEGGATEFTRLSLRIRPKPGGLLLWNNALPDGRPNPYTLHAARPVVRGTKYIVTKWFRSHTWQ
ncbi:2OG-Fe(II) oxygenase [Novosphingobium decolorationis]|uniref:2OG-Fe(II) oxygenase n=1 Tax=Novosphingobium decolorationis TaxID=2698673 RepID=A0ABX8E131_9SPHN|nr:2OG-Fe(II) oxygenase [Novosphingobium decolorationis]QVM82817.1 2OG-Fe(II) oxygenase [Novosphingobium decolorationis]